MIRRNFIGFLAASAIALAAFVFNAAPVLAVAGEPDQLIRNLAGRAIALMQEANVSDADRKKRLRDLLAEGFNIEAIARFTVGRYWRKASNEEQTRFLELFEDWIVQIYFSRFRDYSSNTLNVVETIAENDRKSVVATEILSPDGVVVEADWHMQKFRNGYKVIDVEIEGVRMAVAQRSEFFTIIKREGGKLDGLITVLEKQIQ